MAPSNSAVSWSPSRRRQTSERMRSTSRRRSVGFSGTSAASVSAWTDSTSSASPMELGGVVALLRALESSPRVTSAVPSETCRSVSNPPACNLDGSSSKGGKQACGGRHPERSSNSIFSREARCPRSTMLASSVHDTAHPSLGAPAQTSASASGGNMRNGDEQQVASLDVSLDVGVASPEVRSAVGCCMQSMLADSPPSLPCSDGKPSTMSRAARMRM
eukprot:scaffold38203_cov32-Tisochrysis_lutea.AAC.5